MCVRQWRKIPCMEHGQKTRARRWVIRGSELRPTSHLETLIHEADVGPSACPAQRLLATLTVLKKTNTSPSIKLLWGLHIAVMLPRLSLAISWGKTWGYLTPVKMKNCFRAVQVSARWTVARLLLNFLQIINFCKLFLRACEVPFSPKFGQCQQLKLRSQEIGLPSFSALMMALVARDVLEAVRCVCNRCGDISVGNEAGFCLDDCAILFLFSFFKQQARSESSCCSLPVSRTLLLPPC